MSAGTTLDCGHIVTEGIQTCPACAPRQRSHQRFEMRHRMNFYDARLPSWKNAAACGWGSRSGGAVHSVPMEVWSPMFKDDLADRRDGSTRTKQVPVLVKGEIEWHEQSEDLSEYKHPADVLRAMEVCAKCPVRDLCLAEAFKAEIHEVDQGEAGIAPGHDTPVRHVEDDRRFGIYGGIPGRMRERFAPYPDRLERAAAWFQSFTAKRGWALRASERGVA